MKELWKILNEFNYTKEEAEDNYMSVLLDTLNYDDLKEVELWTKIKYLIDEEKIAVNKILDYFKDYFKWDYFLDELPKYTFLWETDFKMINKFIKKEAIWELIFIFSSKGKWEKYEYISNEKEDYIEEVKFYLDMYIDINKVWEDLGLWNMNLDIIFEQ